LRWSFYWENRLDENDYIVNLPKMVDSILANGNAFNNKVNSSNLSTDDWKPLGLIKKPFDYLGKLGTEGVGMVYTIEVNPLNSNIVLAGTPNGGIWRTDNAGLSWRPIKLLENNNNTIRDLGVIGVLAIKIDPLDTSRIFIATGSRELEVGYTHKYSYGVLLSQNSGETWQRTGLTSDIIENENINALAIIGNVSLSNVKVYAVGKNNIYISNNGAQSFITKNAKDITNFDLNFTNIEVVPGNGQTIVAAGSALLVSYDGGVNWIDKTTSLANFTIRNRFNNGDFNNGFVSWHNSIDYNIVNYSGNNVCEIKYNSTKSIYIINHRKTNNYSNLNNSSSFRALIPLNSHLAVTYYYNYQIIDTRIYSHTTNSPIFINEFLGNLSSPINRIEYKFVLEPGFQNSILPWIDDSKIIYGVQPNLNIIIDVNNINSDKINIITKTDDLKDYFFEETNVVDFTCQDYRNITKPDKDQLILSLTSSSFNANIKYFGARYLYTSNILNSNFSSNTKYIDHDDIRDIKCVLDNQNNEIIYIAHDGGVAVSYNNGNSYIDRSNGLQIANFYNLSVSENDPNLIIGGVHDNSTFVLSHGNWYTTSAGDGFGQTLLLEDKYTRDEYSFVTNMNYNMDIVTYNKGVFSVPRVATGPSYSWMARFIDRVTVNNQSILYAVDRNSNTIQKSTNKGQNWTSITVNSIPSTEEYSNMEMSDDNMVWVLTTWSGTYPSIYFSTDGGATFTKRTYPTTQGITDIEIYKNGNDYDIWVSIGGFNMAGNRVLYTTSSTNSWTEIGGNTIGEYPVNTLAYDNVNNVLFAGTDRGVYYFDNSNNTWYEYNTDLPKCIITKLVISYSNNKLRAATFGRGVWETNLKECVYYSATPEYIEGTITYSTETRATKDIVILSGATLTVSSKLFMPNNSTITVRKGGKLVIDGGVITNYCGGMWNGIVVEGTALMAQSTTNHGWCEVKNGGVIENARIAIKSNDGGIVKVSSGKFINNRFGIFFGRYNLVKNQLHTNYSVIANSEFKCYREMNDRSYVDEGKYEGSKYFIGIAQQSGVRIINNTFESTYHPRVDLKGTGIVTWASRTYIVYNEFKGLTYGIEAAGYNNALQYNSIYHNNFTDVSLGITETAQAGSKIVGNTFSISPYENSTWLKESYGVMTDNSMAFDITANTFDVMNSNIDDTYGVLIKNSGNTTPANITHNTFQKTKTGTQLERDNQFIFIQCNVFEDSDQDISINPVLMGSINTFGNELINKAQSANMYSGSINDGPFNIRLNENMLLNVYSVEEPLAAKPTLNTINVTVFNIENTIYDSECETYSTEPCNGQPCPSVEDATELVNNNQNASEELVFGYKMYLAQQLADSGMFEELKQLINSEQSALWNELKLPIYIEFGLDADVQSLINALPSGSYKDYMQIAYNLTETEAKIDSLGDNGTIEQLYTIANSNTETAKAAQKILELFYSEKYSREAERWEGSNMLVHNPNNDTTILIPSNEKEDENKKMELNSSNSKITLNIMPNPNNGNFTIKIDGASEGDIEICDMSGKILYTKKLNNTNEIQFFKQELAPGVYVIRYQNPYDKNNLYKKIIILE
jgi:Secretion system C-terminal sorting domain